MNTFLFFIVQGIQRFAFVWLVLDITIDRSGAAGIGMMVTSFFLASRKDIPNKGGFFTGVALIVLLTQPKLRNMA